MGVALVVAALITGTVVGTLPRYVLQRIGFAPRDLWGMDLLRLFTSALVTHGRGIFASALVLTMVSVGAVERRYGTVIAAISFWAAHVWTLVVTSTVAAWGHEGILSQLGLALVSVRDVGPSAGYFGTIGVALWSVRSVRVRGVAWVALVAWLVADLGGLIRLGPALRQEASADFAHLIAFLSATLACVVVTIVKRVRRPRPR
jgi:hypothetical protein